MLPLPSAYEWIVMLSTLLWSMVVHEVGHCILYYAAVRRWPDLRVTPKAIIVGKTWDYIVMGRRKRILVYASGPLLGLVPIVLSGIILGSKAAYLIPAWIGACWADFKLLWISTR